MHYWWLYVKHPKGIFIDLHIGLRRRTINSGARSKLRWLRARSFTGSSPWRMAFSRWVPPVWHVQAIPPGGLLQHVLQSFRGWGCRPAPASSQDFPQL